MVDDIATHQAPVWRTKANFLIVADLTCHGMPGRWEQIWARLVAIDEFEICCIPYFTYGLALGDLVRTTSAAGKTHVITQVIIRSGRHLLRLWLKNSDSIGKEQVYRYLVNRAPLHEWGSENLLVIDASKDDHELIDLVADLGKHGIESEWAH